MGEIIAEIILFFSELALNIQEFFFRKKRNKSSVYEEENNLPKKRMIAPYQRLDILVAFLIFGFIILAVAGFFYFDGRKQKTEEKIVKIRKLLEKEKTVFEKYPKELKTIIRNNPLRIGILQDLWKNDFRYQQLEHGKSYTLFSVGKDGKANTYDDIK